MVLGGLLMLIFLLSWGRTAQAETLVAQEWQQTIERIDFSRMEEFKRQIDQEVPGLLGEKSSREWMASFVKGDWKMETGKLGKEMWAFFWREVKASSHLLGKILILAVIMAVLVNMESSLGQGQVVRISRMACFLALSAIALGSFKYVIKTGLATIDGMSSFMAGMLPQMMLLLTGLGHVNTAAALFPLLSAASSAFAYAMEKIVFPLIVFSALLNLVDCLSDTVKVQRMGKLAATLAEVVMGLMLTIFIGLFTLRSIYGSVLDAVTLKTGKFLADNFFPVIGGFLADVVDTAAGYVILLKQGLGVFGMLVVLGIFVFPMIKIGVVALMYKLAAALVEPIGDEKTGQVLDTMGGHLLLIMASVASVGLMFLVIVAILTSIGNSLILVR